MRIAAMNKVQVQENKYHFGPFLCPEYCPMTTMTIELPKPHSSLEATQSAGCSVAEFKRHQMIAEIDPKRHKHKAHSQQVAYEARSEQVDFP